MEINEDEETALEFFTYGMYEEEAESKIIDEEPGAIDTYFSESFPLVEEFVYRYEILILWHWRFYFRGITLEDSAFWELKEFYQGEAKIVIFLKKKLY